MMGDYCECCDPDIIWCKNVVRYPVTYVWAVTDPGPRNNCCYPIPFPKLAEGQNKEDLIPMTLHEFAERTKEINARSSR